MDEVYNNFDEGMVILEMFREDELIGTKYVDLYTWFDGDVPEIDSNEYHSENGITKIIITQYDDDGKIYSVWRNFYDKDGSIGKSKELYHAEEG